MTRTVYAPGAYYHIYNRGVNRQPVFFADRNWAFFIRRLRDYFTDDRAIIVAYCLMPNHYHLLVYVTGPDFSFKVMQPLGTSYTKAVNAQEQRVGALFQGRFRGALVDNERYLLHLSRYIHRNPVEAGLVAHPADWAYSSYRDYLGLRQGTLPKPEVILSQFASIADYATYVEGEGENDGSIGHLLLD